MKNTAQRESWNLTDDRIVLWSCSIFINGHENGLDLSLSASNTNTKRVMSTLGDVIKIQREFDRLEKQPG